MGKLLAFLREMVKLGFIDSLKKAGGKSMKLIFRKLTPEDLDALDRVMLVISDKPADRAKMGPLVEKINRDPEKYLLAAFDQDAGVLCGSLLGVVFEDICGDCKPILLVENVAVLPEYQGKGVGRAMFEEIERWGREMDCHYEILVSGMRRTGAHKFYKALGFDEVKGFKKYFP